MGSGSRCGGDVQPYQLEIGRGAIKRLRALPQDLRRRIRQRLDQLAANLTGPQPQAKAPRGQRGMFRLRIGGWRATYEVDHRRRVVRVLEVEPGHDAYD